MAKGILMLLMAGTAGFAANAQQRQPAGCAQAIAAAPRLTVCVETPNGIVIGTDQAEVERLAGFARAGEERFRRHFGSTPTRYAVAMTRVGEEVNALRRSGHQNLLPWATAEEFQSSVETALREAVTTSARAAGDTEAQAAAKVEREIQRSREQGARRRASESGVVPHELGHRWLVNTFWPNWDYRGQSHYGGPGPDWLDEMAAVLMEDEPMTADRRSQFGGAYRGRTDHPVLRGISRERLTDLSAFTTLPHPTAAAGPPPSDGARRIISEQRGVGAGPTTGAQAPVPNSGAVTTQSGSVRVVYTSSRNATPADIARTGDAILFYLQSRMLADYLIDRTGRQDVFRDLGRAMAAGQSMDQWLQASGAQLGLPTSLAALTTDWKAWLERTIPA